MVPDILHSFLKEKMNKNNQTMINKVQLKIDVGRCTLARVSELPVTKTVPLALNAQQNI